MMKRNIIRLFIILFTNILVCTTLANSITDNTANAIGGQSIQPYTVCFSYSMSNPVRIEVEGFSLLADSGSLQHDLDINLTLLSQEKGYRIPSNMENLTPYGRSMRLLPNGEHFSKDNPAQITLSYDPNKLPLGYRAENIYTYYCDSITWHQLERVDIDTIAHTITSLTTHFTDFINAVIKVPDMPESKAFVPTTMADLPEVNPLQGVPMIDLPLPNNRGTAELVYPIVLPKGRQGMQPNVDLNYSSAGGNSILGVGWSINTPSVTIDTRWGVPRFDPLYETEQYIVNGAPILLRKETGIAFPLPYQESGFFSRETNSVRFYARDTKNQDRVIRHGTNPTNYWWEVTDRNGITTFYGRRFNPEDIGDVSIDESSVIRTESNCIAYWAATASVDVHGNYILYTNHKEENTIYVQHILYTGNFLRHIDPCYRVQFAYRERNDISTNGRLGVLQRETLLLCHLLVQYNTSPWEDYHYIDNIAAYYMQYSPPKETSLYKSRLEEVAMLDSVHDLMLDEICSLEDILDGNVERNDLAQRWMHQAEMNGDMVLYRQIREALGDRYGVNSIPAHVTKFAYEDAPTADQLFSEAENFSDLQNTSLSSNQSSSWSVGGTATVGSGPDVFTTNLSGGGNYDYNCTTGRTKSMLLDLNGDALVDIVYEKNGGVYYHRQRQQNGNYNFAREIQVPGLTRLSREVTRTHTWGLQASFGANLSYSNPISNTYVEAYFSDVNADGLPDMIDGEYILINQLVDGVPTFGPYSVESAPTISNNSSRCGVMILDGEVDKHIECKLIEVLVDSFSIDEFYDASVDDDWRIEEVNDERSEHPEMYRYDGEIVEHPHQDEVYNDINTSISNRPDLYPIQLVRQRTSQRITDTLPNDSLIYRIEGEWVKVYKLEYECALMSIDPDIETVRVWVAPKDGSITLTDSIALLEDTSISRRNSHTVDGIAYTIQHCGDVVNMDDSLHLHANSYSIWHQGSLLANDYTWHTRSFDKIVQKGDVIMFRLRSGENNRFDRTQWHHTIQYSDEEQVYDSQNDFLCTGDGYFRAIYDGEIHLTLSGNYGGTESVSLKVEKTHDNQTTYLLDTVLQGGDINILPINVSVVANDNINIILSPINATYQEPRWSDIHLIPHLQYIADFPTNDTLSQSTRDTIDYYPDVKVMHSSIYPSTSAYRSLFGPLHKGWGVFAHHNLMNNDTIFIDSLVNTQLLAAQTVSTDTTAYNANLEDLIASAEGDDWYERVNEEFSENNTFNPLSPSNYWIPMRADSRTGQWIAHGNMGTIGKTVHSNAREIIIREDIEEVVEYDSSLPFVGGEMRQNNFVFKHTRSIQHSISAGVLGIYNEFTSKGTYQSIVDYMDMNGDGYPDHVGVDGVQYSMPWGGIGTLQKVKNFKPFESENIATGVSFSACPAVLKKLAGNNIRDGKFSLSDTYGAGANSGQSNTINNYIDINADGLPDRIDTYLKKVYYNTGYGFANATTISSSINNSNSIGGSLNVGVGDEVFSHMPAVTDKFSLAQVSISGGVGSSLSTDNVDYMLTDINGDGLPDKVRLVNNQVQVAYNIGERYSVYAFDSWKTLSTLNSIGKNTTANLSTTISGTLGFSILGTIKFDFGVQSSWNGLSISQGEGMLVDMNGDGYVDYVWNENNQVCVRYNTSRCVNLLTAVTNPTGQQIRMAYKLSEPSTNHRNRQWDLAYIADIDSTHPMHEMQERITILEYKDAFYDTFEKTDYGYAHVRTISNNEKVKDSYYYNQSFLQKGELQEELISNTNEQKYVRYIHGSRYTNIDSGEELEPDEDLCGDANLTQSQYGYWTEYFEGEDEPLITTYYNIEYDQYHNVVSYIDEGDIAIDTDDWYKTITYLPTTANNMISLPKQEQVYDFRGRLLRNSKVDYSFLGQPEHIYREIAPDEYAITHLQYDDFGNISTIIFPENENNEHHWSTFTYDPVTYSYVLSIDNPFNTQTTTYYDLRWGVPIRVIDPTGNEMLYKYDYKGRLIKILAPDELIQGKDHTVKYSYNIINDNLKRTTQYPFTHVYKEMYDLLFVQCEVTLYDRRGESIQNKHYAEVFGVDNWVVDNAQERDVFGRVIAQNYPFASESNPWEYEPIDPHQPMVETLYDVLDRPIRQINADGTEKYIYYHFDDDVQNNRRFKTELWDENGIVTSELKAPQGWTIQKTAGDGAQTFFHYSPIGELLFSQDAEEYRTYYAYDRLGRTIMRNHPDAGVTRWTFDPAGNMIRLQTANLAANDNSIEYHYSFNRLAEINYPLHPENDVQYLYDNAGRIARRLDGTGGEEFVYDCMGNVSQSIRRIVIPTERSVYYFRTQYKYDSFGRMRNIIYPDGEVVHYGYATGGLLKSVAGIKQGEQNIYLWDRIYDEQGRKISQLFGNRIQTDYTYDGERQRLVTMQTRSLTTGDQLQDIEYEYDYVGNISRINQYASSCNGLGGAYVNEYFYDEQYRLVESIGTDDFQYNVIATYSPSGRLGNKYTTLSSPSLPNMSDVYFGYDDQHLTHQPRTLYDIMSGRMNLYWDANGNIAEMIHCEQDARRFHEWDEDNRLRFVLGERFAGYYGYDANGERVYKLTGTCGIDQINHNGTRAYVMFDDAVLYPNPYLVVTPRGYTKHYYAGTERLATAIGSGGFDDMGRTIGHYASREEDIAQMFYANYQNEDPFHYDHILSEMIGTSTIEGDNMPELEYRREPIILGRVDVIGGENLLYSSIEDNLPVRDRERELFFSHSDHLGSANWITDYDGIPIQYLHYAPYGELVENQRVTDYDERYKFTGKERDWETGYDYFGARYWWRAGTWLSVDPLSDKYPHISPYAYCGWNPVNKIDPDGREEWSLDINTGKFQNIGDKGGSITDYYSVGTYEGEKFSSYSNYEIERGDGAINSFRIQETDKSTISAFHIPEENTSGFILERPGPDTSESGQSLRIPAGQYGLHANDGSHYPGAPRLYLPNEGIEGNFDKRGILIHVGNYPEDSKGCLLPGSIRTKDFVGNSGKTLPMISGYCVSKKWMVKLNIFNAFK